MNAQAVAITSTSQQSASLINPMLSFSSTLLALAAAAGVLAAPVSPASPLLDKRQSEAPGTGTNNGYYWSYYNSGGGSATFTLGSGSEYSLSWEDDGDIVAGTGYNPGSAQYVETRL